MSYRRVDLAPEYVSLWQSCEVTDAPRVHEAVERIRANRSRYAAIEAEIAVPWWFVGTLHNLECGCRFDKHLHNGDPLTQRTTNVPNGRPPAATWTWEESAIDALTMKGWERASVLRGPDGLPDWSLPTVLWRFEVWNGFGYRARGVRSPYLWAATNHEQPGRYVADGEWNPNAMSRQAGAAAVIKGMGVL